MEQLKAIILAAGEGTRMKSKKPKVLHEIMHKPMVEYVIDTAKDCGAEAVCVVIGHKADMVEAAIQREDVTFAMQTERKGTGHAVKMAGDFIEENKDILILYGDTPLITGQTLKGVIAHHRAEKNAVTVVSALVEDPTGYGRIIRDENGKFVKSVEHKDATEAERAVKEINTGLYVFAGGDLKGALGRLKNDNAQGEYYLPDCLEILLADGKNVGAYLAADETEFFGVNSRVQLAEAAAIMQRRINRRHMENGVTIADPEHTYIGPDVEIGMDTVILPGCWIEGKTVIGEDCEIGPNSRLTDMRLGDGIKFQTSTALESEIGSGTTVGPFAYIRPNCHIGEGVKVGDFVEVKNSNIGNGTKIPHLCYVGDTDAGEKINFGCGSIMVNYDGEKKHRTTIGDRVFVGCNVNLVAPVTVEKDAYIAAGSTITRDVPEDVLAVARARQTVIRGWKQKRLGQKS
ncbi:bifunctional UDP-N-acetylglucosamine diphosphorylase/glucosamine-1-phosphate N-acetyltransferase GlmU [Anaerotignum lactatifermentans]|uniref:Bifunctional protein GlmU n=1 Tax=Anaerotignum lactatifermentans TaxID=160404 RepID=A0ABS2GCH2_9FIRM|nr:bifunctional UDP-N-acetylglucosamine diphosphorylase/glucosamine-1-phosphate N-acetyltransferase GlmU [Anaerotignum lactatifermentans]MBM6828649.1 bifunctional UDP-N-acetylglucosamine diphosphorylase/glucosamine-1-phosphate N-acetyltransferase GlmU [Anaerotignum lactatifermentans]MBM6878567.1 bifunctional UDP-N-acetylglucosamine diphosphorylase/glucosamine-1-phosphate N-acetyltransferase GlmU [Anaerotignum lactatifermentans]MBM6950231.1 bifunctional UDP-N-acetylglucosamine diphosphorylase/glu